MPKARPPAPFGYPSRKLIRPTPNSSTDAAINGIAGAPSSIRSADSENAAITNCSSVFWRKAAATAIFGDFSQVIFAEWGALELAANPYANFPAGITGIRAFLTADVGVRIAGAFSASSSIT